MLLERTRVMRLLIVEDDKKLAAFITRGFQEAGFAVDCCGDGREGLIMAEKNDYAAVIVDVMLPHLGGLQLVQKLRERGATVAVLMLSAKGTVDDRVKGLQAGGDDYLIKPFAFVELLARVHALVRRASRIAEPSALQVADLKLDLLSRRVTRAGEQI